MMPERIIPNLKNVAVTLLIPLYSRALESQRPDALLRDDKASEIVKKMDCDFSHLKLSGHDEISVILRMREFDRRISRFLERNPDGVVVHIGCGLDTRFERVDNGMVEWFDLDLPEVVDLRNALIDTQGERYHLLSGSVLDEPWMKSVEAYADRPVMFAAEGVLVYFEAAQVKDLVLRLRIHFPGAELVCDGHKPYVIWADNLQLAALKLSARVRWGLKHPRDLESWGEGIALLDEWYYFEGPEPRVKPYRWMSRFPLLAKSAGIFQYRLG